MNASIPAALLMLLLAGGWLLGRRRTRPFLRTTDTSAVAALNRTQIERLRERSASAIALPLSEEASPQATSPPPGVPPITGAEAPFPALPLQPRERVLRLRQLRAGMQGTREQRLQAMEVARQSSRPEVLPLLRLGLRDPDPAVMAAAAAAMTRFRGLASAVARVAPPTGMGRAVASQPGRAAGSPPRNRVRTR